MFILIYSKWFDLQTRSAPFEFFVSVLEKSSKTTIFKLHKIYYAVCKFINATVHDTFIDTSGKNILIRVVLKTTN